MMNAIKATAESLFEVVKDRSSTDELVIICPQPGCADKSGNCSINLKTGKVHCWRCSQGGNFFFWARKLGYAVEADTIINPDLSEIEKLSQESSDKMIVPVMSSIELPKGFRKLKDNRRSTYYRLTAEMAERKNLHIDDFIAAGAGYTMTDPNWEPYTIFPVLEWGKLVYYQGRVYGNPTETGTKKFPSRHQVPLGSKYWVYNIDEAREKQARIVIIVEAIFNVLSLKNKLKELGRHDIVPVAVFKHSISRPQLSKLLALKSVREFNLMFDADSVAEAWKSAKALVNQRVSTTTEIPSDGNRTQDPNDNVDLAYECFLKRRRYSPVEDLSVQLDKLF